MRDSAAGRRANATQTTKHRKERRFMENINVQIYADYA